MAYKDKEKKREHNKAYRETNKESLSVKNKAYREANKDKIAAQKKAYRKARRASDPAFKAIVNFRRRLNELGAKARVKSKCPRFEYYYGCSPEKYEQHIKSQFTEGMTWKNTQIDHIIPLSLGKTEQEWIMLNHFTNLRPMWAAANIAKGDNLPDFIPEGFPYWQHFLIFFEIAA